MYEDIAVRSDTLNTVTARLWGVILGLGICLVSAVSMLAFMAFSIILLF